MASQEGSFGILGSSKLNTQDGKNPPSTTSDATKSNPKDGSRQTSETSTAGNHRREGQSAHDMIEARLKDKELHGRSKDWSG